jgi:sugar O-acyltransferase (sialic acid O-acetyltransferase NeuD family)
LKLCVIGSGALAREVKKYFEHDEDSKEFVVAIGQVQFRKQAFYDIALDELFPVNAIHPSAFIGDIVDYGMQGYVVCPNVTITTNVKLGDNVFINIGCTIGHDVKIGDHTVISPGVNISGNVTIGDECFIGTNACIREGITIGEGVTIGMGAVVINDIPSGETWAGNPARRLG